MQADFDIAQFGMPNDLRVVCDDQHFVPGLAALRDLVSPERGEQVDQHGHAAAIGGRLQGHVAMTLDVAIIEHGGQRLVDLVQGGLGELLEHIHTFPFCINMQCHDSQSQQS